MKAVLIIDMPNNCEECKIIHLQGHGENICDSGDWSKRPDWCPLKPLPQKRINKDCLVVHEIWNEGWNACLDEITGKEDCRNCQEWESCSCGKIGHDNGTSVGYSIGECKHYKEKQNESK